MIYNPCKILASQARPATNNKMFAAGARPGQASIPQREIANFAWLGWTGLGLVGYLARRGEVR